MTTAYLGSFFVWRLIGQREEWMYTVCCPSVTVLMEKDSINCAKGSPIFPTTWANLAHDTPKAIMQPQATDVGLRNHEEVSQVHFCNWSIQESNGWPHFKRRTHWELRACVFDWELDGSGADKGNTYYIYPVPLHQPLNCPPKDRMSYACITGYIRTPSSRILSWLIASIQEFAQTHSGGSFKIEKIRKRLDGLHLLKLYLNVNSLYFL